MAKRIILKVDISCQKCKKKIMHAVSRLEGIDKIEFDAGKSLLTVVGIADPIEVIVRVRKAGRFAHVVSIGPWPLPPPPPPPQQQQPPQRPGPPGMDPQKRPPPPQQQQGQQQQQQFQGQQQHQQFQGQQQQLQQGQQKKPEPPKAPQISAPVYTPLPHSCIECQQMGVRDFISCSIM